MRRRRPVHRIPRKPNRRRSGPVAGMGSTSSDLLALLGIAHRAGTVERGMAASRRAVREGRAHLVLVAEDASAQQLEKLARLSGHRDVPLRRIAAGHALGAALGTAPLSAVAVTRRRFAESILGKLPD